ncbi:MAG: branched chain amino acid aminotransferase, partial [Clostridia bacterium]|nr:branched chain amino acid aminotransferase [Clostridia bacterium]
MQITKTLTTSPKAKPTGTLGFGKIFTDHMFIMDYSTEKGWHDARIVPYGEISLSPACMVFHYGQEMFEGMKAYRAKDGRILLFRPEKNIERMNNTNERMCIPQVDKADVLQAIEELVWTDSDWIPTEPGTSLYIR